MDFFGLNRVAVTWYFFKKNDTKSKMIRTTLRESENIRSSYGWIVVRSRYESIWWVSGFVFGCCWIRFVTCFRCRCRFHQSCWVLLDDVWWRSQYRFERWYGRCSRCHSCIFECSRSSLVAVLWAIQLMVDELPFVEMTILSHITKIDSFDIDPLLLVIKLRLFVFDIRWFPSSLQQNYQQQQQQQ